MPHLCFYSARCKFSRAFLEELQKTSYSKDFKFICVDPSPTRPKLPEWLKSVPALVIDGEQEPRVDSEVFNWLSAKKLGEAKPGGPSSLSNNEPLAYGMEMSSGKWSDNYSFFNSEFDISKGQGFDPIPRTFSHLQEPASFSAGPAAEVKKPLTKKEEALSKAFDAFQKQRDRDIPQAISRT